MAKSELRVKSSYFQPTLGAVTHSTVNGISLGKFSCGTSHLGFSIPLFQQLHANSDFPRQNKSHANFQSQPFCNVQQKSQKSFPIQIFVPYSWSY